MSVIHDQKYLELLQDLLDTGERKSNRTGIDTIGLLGYQMKFDLQEGFPLLTSKKLPLRWIFEELRWFLSGSVDVRDLQAAKVDIWDEWATERHNGPQGRAWWNMGPIYSHQWRNFGATSLRYIDFPAYYAAMAEQGCAISDLKYEDKNRTIVGYANDGFDQISRLQEQFRGKSASRRLILSGWNPADADIVALPPCHTFSQWSVTPTPDGHRLDCHLFQRSADVFLGVPFNIASYALLTHMFARVCGLYPGTFTHTFHDVHIYENHVDQVKEQISRTPPESPTVKVEADENTNIWNLSWDQIKLSNYNPLAKIKAEVAV